MAPVILKLSQAEMIKSYRPPAPPTHWLEARSSPVQQTCFFSYSTSCVWHPPTFNHRHRLHHPFQLLECVNEKRGPPLPLDTTPSESEMEKVQDLPKVTQWRRTASSANRFEKWLRGDTKLERCSLTFLWVIKRIGSVISTHIHTSRCQRKANVWME